MGNITENSHLKKLGNITFVPNGWTLTTVGQACNIRNNLRKPLSVDERKKIQGEYPYYGPTGVLDYIDHYMCDGKFALIGEDGDHYLKPKEKSQTILVDGKFNVNNHAHIVEGTNICSVEWFYTYFRNRDITHMLSRQGANRYKLNKQTLEGMPILLPCLSEQKAIAETLQTWDTAIEKTQALIAAKEQEFTALTQKLIVNEHKTWLHLHLNKIFKPISERNTQNAPLLSVTQDRGVIPRNMLEGRVMSPTGAIDNYKIIKQGDFVVSLRSFQGGLEFSNYQGAISPAYTVLRPNIEISSNFYTFFFKSFIFISKYLKISVIGIRDGKQIDIEGLLKTKIPYPPLAEQKAIAETLSTAQKEIDILKKLVEKYQLQKRGLMQKLLTGQVRLQY